MRLNDDDDEAESKREHFLALSFSASQAQAQTERQRRFTDTFLAHRRSYHTLVAPAMIFSHGRVPFT